jgi:hypothetical protein
MHAAIRVAVRPLHHANHRVLARGDHFHTCQTSECVEEALMKRVRDVEVEQKTQHDRRGTRLDQGTKTQQMYLYVLDELHEHA